MKRLIMLATFAVLAAGLAQTTTIVATALTATTTLQEEVINQQALDTLVLSQEFETIGTETYYLASVENSGVDGHLHVAEMFEGGSRLVVTMNNILNDYRYAVVLYQGNCGPDRPEVLRLGDINNSSGDPNTSITETDLSFEQLTTGDYFMYVFAGEPGTQVLACGEVGVGANQ